LEKSKKWFSRQEAQELQKRWWQSRGKAIEISEQHKDVCAVKFSVAE